MSEDVKKYTAEEERWNAVSHSVGIVGGLVVSALFVKEVVANGGDCWALASVLLYMFGMLSSYTFSTLYHSCAPESKWRKTLRKFDHSAIYWHIAGSYSPITLIAMRDVGYWGWGIFAFCWLCAIVGTSLSFYSLKKHNILETVCYVLMGLTIIVAMKQFYNAVPLSVFLWVVGEGVAYITGAVFYSFHKVKYIHTVFHFFVLLGTMCHMIAVWGVLKGML
ncbi:MAG: hemolysin III family protein [Bacteroidaceae bacterium]|nr:hemolysin III family protein [Bacteroidaceae bacterium]